MNENDYGYNDQWKKEISENYSPSEIIDMLAEAHKSVCRSHERITHLRRRAARSRLHISIEAIRSAMIVEGIISALNKRASGSEK